MLMFQEFIKMHGLGNDFVILDGRGRDASIASQDIRRIAARRTGVGCDQLIILSDADDAGLFMRIYNPDGSEAEACGNATRCVASILLDETKAEACVIRTVAGLLKCRRSGQDMYEVDMGPARLAWDEIPLAEKCDTLHLPIPGDPVAVSMGNPHCVFFVGNADDVDVAGAGPGIEHHVLFPRRTNVEFASVISRKAIRMRVWERSAGITMACGSAACATIVAAVRRGLTDRKAELVLDGGSLFLEWRETDGHVLMTGPVSTVFAGRFDRAIPSR